jgi:hypothetical protein
MLQGKPQATIAEAFGEGRVYQCGHPNCGKSYGNTRNLSHHHGMEHTGPLASNSNRPRREFFQSIEFERRKERMNQEQGQPEEANQEQQREERRVAPILHRRRRPDIHPNPLQADPDSQELETDHSMRYREQRRREFRRKPDEHYDNTARAANIPLMSQAEIRRVKKGLMDPFKVEINPMMEEFEPRSDDHEYWLIFEEGYEKALDLIRLHIMRALKRDEKQLYGQKRINAKIQEARAKKSEELFMTQNIEARLMRLK